MKTIHFACAVLVATFAIGALAQTNTVLIPPDPIQTSQSDIWKFGVSFITPLLIAMVKWGVPKVPKLLLPSLAPFVGIVIGLAFNAIGGMHLSWVDSAQLGALGVFVRELVDQATKLQAQQSANVKMRQD